MNKKPTTPVTQQEFLQASMEELGLDREQFAARLGCPWTTFKRWIAPSDAAGNYREMPAIAWSLVREALAHERLRTEHAGLQEKVTKDA